MGHNHVARESPDVEPGPQDHPLFMLGHTENSPMVVAMAIKGKEVHVEVDTGAARSVISEMMT